MKDTRDFQAVGIIAEYNPLHNGHVYHIEKARALSGADFCVVVMSGDFVQRGEPALYDKYARTAMALEAGADLVLEMPAAYATSSAENFAACGVALLDKLKVVRAICFGSECGDTDQLLRLASVLAREPAPYTAELKNALRSGLTFPQAREKALCASGLFSKAEAGILASPNNLLGIEYCKALCRRASLMQPLTVTRAGNGYHDLSLSGEFGSASALRTALLSGEPAESLAHLVPGRVLTAMRSGFPLQAGDLSLLLNAALLCHREQGTPLDRYADVSRELARRMAQSTLDFASYEDRVRYLKTRQYTYTRVSRALLHLLLGITKEDMAAYRRLDDAPYARVLGFKRSSSPLLAEIKKRGDIPLITKTADADRILRGTPLHMLRQDMFASHLYQAAVQEKYGFRMRNEYTRSVLLF